MSNLGQILTRTDGGIRSITVDDASEANSHTAVCSGLRVLLEPARSERNGRVIGEALQPVGSVWPDRDTSDAMAG